MQQGPVPSLSGRVTPDAVRASIRGRRPAPPAAAFQTGSSRCRRGDRIVIQTGTAELEILVSETIVKVIAARHDPKQ